MGRATRTLLLAIQCIARKGSKQKKAAEGRRSAFVSISGRHSNCIEKNHRHLVDNFCMDSKDPNRGNIYIYLVLLSQGLVPVGAEAKPRSDSELAAGGCPEPDLCLRYNTHRIASMTWMPRWTRSDAASKRMSPYSKYPLVVRG